MVLHIHLLLVLHPGVVVREETEEILVTQDKYEVSM